MTENEAYENMQQLIENESMRKEVRKRIFVAFTLYRKVREDAQFAKDRSTISFPMLTTERTSNDLDLINIVCMMTALMGVARLRRIGAYIHSLLDEKADNLEGKQ